MTLKIAWSNSGLPRILLGNADFVFLMKAQITQKKIIFPKLFSRIMLGRDTRSSLQYSIWLKSKTVKIY